MDPTMRAVHTWFIFSLLNAVMLVVAMLDQPKPTMLISKEA